MHTHHRAMLAARSWRGLAGRQRSLSPAASDLYIRRCRAPGAGWLCARSFSSFGGLKLQQPLLAALEELELSEPTEIQRAAIPAVLGGHDVVIASETGSGKTLAYLLPMVDILKQEEERSRRRGRAVGARLQRPRAVILVPSREVGRQVRTLLGSIPRLFHGVAVSSCHG